VLRSVTGCFSRVYLKYFRKKKCEEECTKLEVLEGKEEINVPVYQDIQSLWITYSFCI